MFLSSGELEGRQQSNRAKEAISESVAGGEGSESTRPTPGRTSEARGGQLKDAKGFVRG